MSTIMDRRIRESLIAMGHIKPGRPQRDHHDSACADRRAVYARKHEAHLVNPAAERALAIMRAAMQRPVKPIKPIVTKPKRKSPDAMRRERDKRLMQQDRVQRELAAAAAFAEALAAQLKVA